MTGAPATGVVVDTMVLSWLLDDRPEALAGQYRDLIGVASVLLAFQTLMELRYGALHAGWGELRRRRLERQVAQLTVVQPDDEMIGVWTELRQRCRQRVMPSPASRTTAIVGSPRPRSDSERRLCRTTESSSARPASSC